MTFEKQENKFHGLEQETQIKKNLLRNTGKYYYILTE
jgi:hypothetical protein